ncbi:uncharacterized protein C8Q71DRAFT_853980 [Rhodofomes roseus]|uniref:Uncharacterized protein n=1 Tax=Rhodofomes roseus TaxID=34475 RepID=A0ABQ8KS92_9APHY|nr:uncharacterized protein C8Q71DRAFT_853980 [Rhodofomes roseus]KAH9841612.1 hypothetical protein C8Q71DRAFT_853980 [Rhodofomes roseus]
MPAQIVAGPSYITSTAALLLKAQPVAVAARAAHPIGSTVLKSQPQAITTSSDRPRYRPEFCNVPIKFRRYIRDETKEHGTRNGPEAQMASAGAGPSSGNGNIVEPQHHENVGSEGALNERGRHSDASGDKMLQVGLDKQPDGGVSTATQHHEGQSDQGRATPNGSQSKTIGESGRTKPSHRAHSRKSSAQSPREATATDIAQPTRRSARLRGKAKSPTESSETQNGTEATEEQMPEAGPSKTRNVRQRVPAKKDADGVDATSVGQKRKRDACADASDPSQPEQGPKKRSHAAKKTTGADTNGGALTVIVPPARATRQTSRKQRVKSAAVKAK